VNATRVRVCVDRRSGSGNWHSLSCRDQKEDKDPGKEASAPMKQEGKPEDSGTCPLNHFLYPKPQVSI
jgi:hypothetical protein